MKNLLIVFTAAGLLMKPVSGTAQQRPAEPKNIPDSINFIWKSIEHDFTAMAEAMPEDKWSFKPTQGEFKGVRSFAEQVKHVACANELGPSKSRAKSRPHVAISAAPIRPRPRPRFSSTCRIRSAWPTRPSPTPAPTTCSIPIPGLTGARTGSRL